MDQIQLVGKMTHLQPRQREARPLLAGLILASVEMGTKASSYPIWRGHRRSCLLEQRLEAWIGTDIHAACIRPIQCLIIAWKSLLLLA